MEQTTRTTRQEPSLELQEVSQCQELPLVLPQLEQEQPPEQELQQQELAQLLELEPQQALVLQRLVQKV